MIYAVKNHLAYGKVKNSSGEFVKADLASVTAAAAGVAITMPDDFRVSITDAPGKGAYPISTFTWLLIPEKISDPAKEKAIVGFVKWAITTGQNDVECLDYAETSPSSCRERRESPLNGQIGRGASSSANFHGKCSTSMADVSPRRECQCVLTPAPRR